MLELFDLSTTNNGNERLVDSNIIVLALAVVNDIAVIVTLVPEGALVHALGITHGTLGPTADLILEKQHSVHGTVGRSNEPLKRVVLCDEVRLTGLAGLFHFFLVLGVLILLQPLIKSIEFFIVLDGYLTVVVEQRLENKTHGRSLSDRRITYHDIKKTRIIVESIVNLYTVPFAGSYSNGTEDIDTQIILLEPEMVIN